MFYDSDVVVHDLNPTIHMHGFQVVIDDVIGPIYTLDTRINIEWTGSYYLEMVIRAINSTPFTCIVIIPRHHKNRTIIWPGMRSMCISILFLHLNKPYTNI